MVSCGAGRRRWCGCWRKAAARRAAAAAAVSRSFAWTGSPCLRSRVHGASVGGGNGWWLAEDAHAPELSGGGAAAGAAGGGASSDICRRGYVPAEYLEPGAEAHPRTLVHLRCRPCPRAPHNPYGAHCVTGGDERHQAEGM
eukprot:COSAG01_NODE_1179_length_11363_cov_18.944701_13_plen_141_part_00